MKLLYLFSSCLIISISHSFILGLLLLVTWTQTHPLPQIKRTDTKAYVLSQTMKIMNQCSGQMKKLNFKNNKENLKWVKKEK